MDRDCFVALTPPGVLAFCVAAPMEVRTPRELMKPVCNDISVFNFLEAGGVEPPSRIAFGWGVYMLSPGLKSRVRQAPGRALGTPASYSSDREA